MDKPRDRAHSTSQSRLATAPAKPSRGTYTWNSPGF